MTFSVTGVSSLLAFFAIGFLSYRFFQYWQRERTTVSKLFFCFVSIFSLSMFITAIAGLLFVGNTLVLKGTVISAAFLQGLAAAVIGYVIIYMKFPKVSPWFGFLIVFLFGLMATYLSIVVPYIPPSAPFLEPSGGINWGFQPLADILRFLVLFITFVPLGLIFTQQFKASENPYIRARALGMGLLLLFGIITGFLDFLLETILGLGAASSDIVFGFFSLFLFIVVFLTQKPPPPEEKYIPLPSKPGIQW